MESMLKQLSRQNAVRKKRKDRGQTLGLFLMALPMMIVVTIFSYIPMGGLIVAFKDYCSNPPTPSVSSATPCATTWLSLC